MSCLVATVAAGASPVCACSPSPPRPADGGGEPCAAGFLGSDAAAPELDLQVFVSGGTVAPLADGGTVPIIEPPQGGRVLFVGVHATNVDGCGLQLTGALRDLATQQARVDVRTIDLEATGDGWGVSGMFGSGVSADISHFSNIPVCPNGWSSTNIYGTTYGLEVSIKDREGREANETIRVTPQCGEPATQAECMCLCMAGYVLGQTCGGDGGAEQ